MTKRMYKRYSEAFRIQVVREYEREGRSLSWLHRRYGVSHITLKKWIQKYSREGVRHEIMTIQRPEERDRLKALEAENERLKKLVAELSLDKAMLESIIEGEGLWHRGKKNGRPSLSRR
ncbi:MAG: transposase [Chloroflexi bacterium]|nr:transposase [Chloroflexota bacterium]